MAAIGRNMYLLLNTIINPYYHRCVFMTDIYLNISLWTTKAVDTHSEYVIRFALPGQQWLREHALILGL